MENKVIGCKGFHHIALHASDFERSYKFYTEGLGFREYRRWKNPERTICLLEMGGDAMLERFSDGAPRTTFEPESGFYVHLALSVEDSAAAFARAITYGATAKKEPSLMTLPSIPPINAVISFVKGPDGEEIEFFEQRP